MDEKQTLLKLIEVFLTKYNMTPSGFGRKFLGNPNFVSDLSREDFSPKLSTVTKVKTRMKNYKPQKERHDA